MNFNYENSIKLQLIISIAGSAIVGIISYSFHILDDKEFLLTFLILFNFPVFVFILIFSLLRLRIIFKKVRLAKKSGICYHRPNNCSADRLKIEQTIKYEIENSVNIKILGATGYNTFGRKDSFLHDAINSTNVAEITVLLLDPYKDNPGIVERVRQLNDGTTIEHYIQEINKSVVALRELEKAGKNVRLYFYRKLPEWKLFIIPSKLWVGKYRPGTHIADSEIFGFSISQDQNNRNFYNYYLEIFDNFTKKIEKSRGRTDLKNAVSQILTSKT